MTHHSRHARHCLAVILLSCWAGLASAAWALDSDADGVADEVDNCTLVANADQRDTNADGYGNVCDADLDDDGVINFGDLALMKAAFFGADADLDGDGAVNFKDLAALKQGFFGSPGPRGSLPGTWWQPAPATRWQWQLQGIVNTGYDVEMYDIDLDVDPATVATLHAAGRIVVCYISAGSWEAFRSDADAFPPEVLGRPLSGFPDERWLDIRQIDLLGPIMSARLDRAVALGCDGVEPDNVDGYTNRTGFPLTAQDQLDYNRWWTDATHERGLSVGLKNDVDQVAELVNDYDWALNEQCFQYDECDLLQPFIAAGKAVFGVEYSGNPAHFCPLANAAGYSWLKLSLDLDDSLRIDCQE